MVAHLRHMMSRCRRPRLVDDAPQPSNNEASVMGPRHSSAGSVLGSAVGLLSRCSRERKKEIYIYSRAWAESDGACFDFKARRVFHGWTSVF